MKTLEPQKHWKHRKRRYTSKALHGQWLGEASSRPLCLATNAPPRTPIHHEGRSLPPVGAFEVRPREGHKGTCDHARATGSQAPPPGGQKAAFGIVWWLFGVHHEGIVVLWGHLDFQDFGRLGVIFHGPDQPLATPLSAHERLPCLTAALLCTYVALTQAPIHHEGRSLPSVGAFEVGPLEECIGNCDQPGATGSQAPPPGP